MSIILKTTTKELRMGNRNEYILKIKAYNQAAETVSVVGESEFLVNTQNKTTKVLEVGVDASHRRQGIATRMYNRAEDETGYRVTPGDVQTEEAEALWEQRGKED